MKKIIIVLILLSSVSAYSSSYNDIGNILRSIGTEQLDGKLNDTGRWCMVTVDERNYIIDERVENFIDFTYFFLDAQSVPTGYTTSFDVNDPRWLIDTTLRIITILEKTGSTDISQQLKYDEKDQLVSVKHVNQTEWCILKRNY